MKRALIAGAAVTVVAAGYLAGLLAMGDALFSIGFVAPAAAGPPPARTAVYSAARIAVGRTGVARSVRAAPTPAPPVAPASVAPTSVAQTLAVGATAATAVVAVSSVQSATACAVPGAANLQECQHAKAGLPPVR